MKKEAFWSIFTTAIIVIALAVFYYYTQINHNQRILGNLPAATGQQSSF